MRLAELQAELRPESGSALAKAHAVYNPDGSPWMGVAFTCPCGKHPVWIPFRAKDDDRGDGPTWVHESGDSLENLTLSPSILDRGCGAHYFIRNGEIVNA